MNKLIQMPLRCQEDTILKIRDIAKLLSIKEGREISSSEVIRRAISMAMPILQFQTDHDFNTLKENSVSLFKNDIIKVASTLFPSTPK